jgi:hypothetical protein
MSIAVSIVCLKNFASDATSTLGISETRVGKDCSWCRTREGCIVSSWLIAHIDTLVRVVHDLKYYQGYECKFCGQSTADCNWRNYRGYKVMKEKLNTKAKRYIA